MKSELINRKGLFRFCDIFTFKRNSFKGGMNTVTFPVFT